MDLIVKLAVVVCLVGLSASMPNGRSDVIPESVIQFGNMISCATGLGQTRAMLDYNGYGCFCGVGGSGSPLDKTDECCVEHDQCYDRVMKSGLCYAENQVYAITYEYEWDKCKTEDYSITCRIASAYTDHRWPDCAALMCECDRRGTMCFAANRDSYNKDYKGYDKSLCV